MKHIGSCLLLAGLLAAVGCMGDSASKRGDATRQASSAREKSAPVESTEVLESPAAPASLLAESQLDANNANEQARAMYEKLQREMARLEKAQSDNANPQ